MSKYDGLIKKIYYDPGHYGSVQETYKDAKKIDSTITVANVKDWFERNVERKKQLRGFNSYISKGPRDEYEVDLFDVNYLGQKEFPFGLLAIDNFTKFMWVEPLKGKKAAELIRGTEVLFNQMRKPKRIYSDMEGGMTTKGWNKWLQENNIEHVMTRGHANTAERAIRTFKDLMTRRLEGPNNQGVKWYDQVRLAILMRYNNKMVNRTIGLTPYEATLSKNEAHVRTMLEINAIRKRKYPDLKVGDKVRLYSKKDKLDKERSSVWSKTVYEVIEIKHETEQEMFYLTNYPKPVLRHELLKVRG